MRSDSSSASIVGKRPRWLLAAPFLAGAPALTAPQWRVLGLVAVASLLDQYDISLFGMALPQIQAGLGIDEAQLGLLGSIVRPGALPGFAIVLFADRVGRRRALLATVLACSVLTGATAFAPDAQTYVALQLLARAFGVAEMPLAVVVIAEELEPASWLLGLALVDPIVIAAARPATAGRSLEEIAPERHPV